MEKRVISTQVQEEDLKIEKSLRPQTLDDYIGQQKAKENLNLHDLDFEQWPEQHCTKEQELMREKGIDERIIHATASHGWNLTVDIKPEHEMEKVLYAADELTGLIGACAIMLPSKSVQDLEVKSLKKKFKNKKFAAGCSRDVITSGAELLDWDLDTLFERTLAAMKASGNVD